MLTGNADTLATHRQGQATKVVAMVQNIKDKIGHYVYVYTDRETGEPFYIGKGQGLRAISHQEGKSHNSALNRRLEDADSYVLEVLAWGLSEEAALQVESAAIDLVGIDKLENFQRGHDSLAYGRIAWDDLIRHLEVGNEPIQEIQHNIVFVSINHTFKMYGNDETALYDSTRGIWNLSLDTVDEYDYIAGVAGGTVRCIYEVACWLPAGSTKYEIRDEKEFKESGRIECVGVEAQQKVLDLYLGRKIELGQNSHYYGPAAGKIYLNPATGQYEDEPST